VESYQDNINQAYDTKFKIPAVYYSTLMSVAFGRSAADAGITWPLCGLSHPLKVFGTPVSGGE
jgi:heterodisulfide reductase subunit B